ncbi:hypothetical protein A2U01_0082516, partial [Trifolium medium]|nr:hypothetical protein [Trifolium medium]
PVDDPTTNETETGAGFVEPKNTERGDSEETSNDDETMQEAEEGGSDILPVSSTSKLFANAGMTEMEFLAMQDSNPAAALKLLLAKKGS